MLSRLNKRLERLQGLVPAPAPHVVEVIEAGPVRTDGRNGMRLQATVRWSDGSVTTRQFRLSDDEARELLEGHDQTELWQELERQRAELPPTVATRVREAVREVWGTPAVTADGSDKAPRVRAQAEAEGPATVEVPTAAVPQVTPEWTEADEAELWTLIRRWETEYL
jgi:hypothetical protein